MSVIILKTKSFTSACNLMFMNKWVVLTHVMTDYNTVICHASKVKNY